MAEKTKCEICDRTFKDADGLTAHNKAKHPEKVPKERKPLPIKKITKNKFFFIVGTLIFLLFLSFVIMNNFSVNKGEISAENIELSESKAIIFKTQNCGCCNGYASYAEQNGIDVEKRDVSDLSSVKSEYGIPQDMNGCHTMLLGDYVIEGHVPIEAINKLLEEKPDIKGLSLPGMPQGSPGMTGTKRGEFTIYALNHDGTYEEFMKI